MNGIRIDKILVVALGFAISSLLGCSPKTSELILPLDTPLSFSNSGSAALPDKWWTVFEDQQLDAQIDSALEANFDLKTAWQRLVAAQAVTDRESSALLPSVDANLQGGVNFPRPDFRGGENVRLGLNSSYELDLWGRFRSNVEAQEFRARAGRADYQTAVISLSAEIARTWYQLATAKQQLQLIEQQIETNGNILSLIRARFGTGRIRSADILRQQQLLASNRAQRFMLQSDIQVLRNQLSVLIGRSPQRSPAYTPDSLPELPPLPETGVPTALVQRRPDVQSAFYLLQAADRDLATAISNQYPRLSFTASTSLRANNLSEVFKNWAYSFGSNLFAPIFFGGELKAEIDRTEAVKNQRLYEYGQAVLIAFQEVEDALIRELKQGERIAVLEQQLVLAEQIYEQLQVGYFNGTANYLDVLTALTQEQQLRSDVLSARLGLLEFRIALYRALAGRIDIGGI